MTEPAKDERRREAQTRLAKVYAVEGLDRAIKELKTTEFTDAEIISLTREFLRIWTNFQKERHK